MSARAAGPRLSDRQRLSWLRLIRTPNVGPASFRELINRFGSAEAALDYLSPDEYEAGLTRLRQDPLAAIQNLENCP